MNLITCPDCGKQVSKRAAFCVNCGCPIKEILQDLPLDNCDNQTIQTTSVIKRDGEYIYFGSYPQSEVKDVDITAALTQKAGRTNTWTSYDYYIENKVSDFMKYTDVEYNGNKYRGVYFTQYRPYYTDVSSSSDNSRQDDNGYYANTIYWFKYEPIKWKILTESNGDAFLVTDMLIDSQDYDHTDDNNYENSSIRSWLNSTFYNTAFSSTEQGKIKTTKVDNSVASTGYSNNENACSDTNDKIFLLSYTEATNSSYGFSSDSSRLKNPTAYAKAQGAYSSSGRGWWWLRSPSYYSYYARDIHYGGYVNYIIVNHTDYGVAAALHLTLADNVEDTEVVDSEQEHDEPTSIENDYYTKECDSIYFGAYPQSKVTEVTLKTALTQSAGSTSTWTSYNYYIDGSTSSFMKYKDITYNGNKYRGVYFTQYRPYYTSNSSSSSNSNQDDNGYNTNTIYWFKYEPIKWKILSESSGDAFLVTDMLLDAQDYNHTDDNNYANSSIRSWLNSTFYNTAFNSTEQGKIKTTKVDNSIASTGYSSNPYVCSDTNDKIFLLSNKEATNISYGLSSDSSRVKNLTAYAKAQGAYSSSGRGGWWLRSPLSDNSIYARGVDFFGGAYSGLDDFYVGSTNCGVAAALHLTLADNVEDTEVVDSEQEHDEPTSIENDYYTKEYDSIYFGAYPQSEVTEVTLKTALTQAAGSTSTWTSYNYYIDGSTSSFMKYKDVTYNGNKYRGVYFAQYRPYRTDLSSPIIINIMQANNGYYTDTIYWFKYEPIKWKILTESNGDAFLVTDMLIDSQDYNQTYDNNYANSSIRNWLNSTFYNTAFNSTEQGKIKTTKVDNSAASTGYSSNPYACSDTNDKIFLLSYKEATNDYGFNSAGDSDDSSREKIPTAYAKAQGAYSDSGRGWWWLRSPLSGYSYGVGVIIFDGIVNYDYVNYTTYGVAAALHLTLS